MVNLEVWKPVVDYEGLYEVSNFGNVRSLKGHNNCDRVKLLAQHKWEYNNYTSYKNVTLYNRTGGRQTIRVHRLVATAFIPNPDNLPCVNHKDENTFNNNVDNLEWCTNQYNTTYGTAIQRAINKRVKIVDFYKDGNLILSFNSVLEAGKYFKVKPQNIARAARGIRKSFHGMLVKYRNI